MSNPSVRQGTPRLTDIRPTINFTNRTFSTTTPIRTDNLYSRPTFSQQPLPKQPQQKQAPQQVPVVSSKSNDFFNHLNSHDLSYFEHFKKSMYYSGKSFTSSICLFIHAFWPDLFEESDEHFNSN